jgi:hypothetical protein
MSTKAILLCMLVAPGALLAATTRRVEVTTVVPLIAEVESPGEVELAPGETRTVTLRVACNLPWLLAVQTDNPRITPSGHHTGSAGGMTAVGHTFVVTLTCAADADGPQRTALVTQLVSGPLVAGLPR